MKKIWLFLGSLAILTGQPRSNALLTNLATAQWTHDKGDPPGSESVMLRRDRNTHGMELLVRFPPGHTVPAHWHDSNERIIVLEGRLSIGREGGDASLDTGGFAFLPAREVQRLACASDTRCTLYLAWDGNPQSHAAK